MTPRQSAAVHLPELAELHALTQSRFEAELTHLVTPDGEWGQTPEWICWPSVNGRDIPQTSWRPPK